MFGQSNTSSLWDWMRDQSVMDWLRRSTTPIVDVWSPTPAASSEAVAPPGSPAGAPLGPRESLRNRPAPAAGRNTPISTETRQKGWEYGKKQDAEADREARERSAAKYRFAGQAVKTAADFADQPPPPPAPMAMTPGGQVTPTQPTTVPLPVIQALISNKPSAVATLFGGYTPSGR